MGKRVDAIIEDAPAIGYYLKKLDTKNEVGIYPHLSDNDTLGYIGYSKASLPLELAQKLHDAEAKLLKSGKLKEIRARWLNEEIAAKITP